MHSSVLKRVRIAAMLFLVILLVLGLTGTSHAAGFQGGVPLQVGDVIACLGSSGSVGGTCRVLRIINGSTVTLLDQFSDGLMGHTYGVALNNTLHAVVTDNGSGSDSNVVVYSIASVNPLTVPATTIPHAAVRTTNASPNNAQAVVVNSVGHIFVGNSGGGGNPPSVVELNPNGTLATPPVSCSSTSNPPALCSNPLTLLPNCTDVTGQLLSMDLSRDGKSLYLTSNAGSYAQTISLTNPGSIQQLSLATGTCTPFASFGPGVALNGIQDVPAGALTAVKASCNGTSPCPPTDETILVVAEGFFDSDGNLGEGIPDSGDDVNICTNSVGDSLVSCALLLDTGGPGLTALPWVAGHQYFDTTTTILDANLHVQQVATLGTSGSNTAAPHHPAWKTDGTTTMDNAVTWTNEGPPSSWTSGGGVLQNQFIIDTSNPQHVQQATNNGTSGEIEPGTDDQPAWNEGGTTTDGTVVWIDRGVATWQMDHSYNFTDAIFDGVNIQQVATASNAGTSGHVQPTFNATVGMTTTDGLTWTDLGTSIVARYPVSPGGSPVSTLQALSLDPLLTDCTVNNCSVSVPLPTVSNFWLGGSGSLNFYEVNFGSGTVTPFNADPTPPAWQANHPYVLGAEIVDPAVHVQMVTKAGTSGGSQPTFNESGSTTTDGTGSSAVTWTDQGSLGAVSSSIQGLRIYGAEGANQAGLTKLFTGSLSSPSFTASVTFPPMPPFTANDVNTWTVTEYAFPSGPAPSSVPVTLYASLIDKASAPANGNNSGATDPGAVGANNQALGNTPCEPTTTKPGKCIIWKADLLVPSGDYLAENFQSPTGIDFGTDVFVDLHYDVTTSVGNVDPPGRSSGSVHSLHEITTAFPPSGGGSSACSYISPTPDGACFKNNRTTLPFVFQCTGLTPSQMASLKNGPPLLSMVQPGSGNPKPAPKTVFLTTTNGKAPFRYDATANDYVFNWSPNKITGKFRACTFDPTNTVQTFCTNFTMAKSCP